MPVLLRMADDGSSRIQEVMELTSLDNLVGRGVGVHVALLDETVSRMHARVVHEGGRWSVMTLNPHNPVRLDGQAVQVLDLEPGTTFELGRVRLRFEMKDPRLNSTLIIEPGQPTKPAGRRTPTPARGTWNTTPAPPPVTPAFEPAPRPMMPQRIEPEAARGSWTAMPPVSDRAPDVAVARVEAEGLEPMPPPMGAGKPAPPKEGGVRVDVRPRPREVASARPEGGLARGRTWPWIVLGIALSLGAAGFMFREKIGETWQRWRDPSTQATGDEGGPDTLASADEASTGAAEAAEAGEAGEASTDSAPEAPTPPQAPRAGPPLPAEVDCSRYESMPDPQSELGRILAQNGRPSGLAFELNPGGQNAFVLEYAAGGQALSFDGSDFLGGVELPAAQRDASASPYAGPLPLGLVEGELDARCVIQALGPAHLYLAGVPLPREVDDGVPIAWRLASGASMVTVGTKLALLRVGSADEALNSSPAPTWTARATRVDAAAGTTPSALFTFREEAQSFELELVQTVATPANPSLLWRVKAPSVTGRTQMASDDEVELYDSRERDGLRPEEMVLDLGPAETDAHGTRRRSIKLRFSIAGIVREYEGQLESGPWRVGG